MNAAESRRLKAAVAQVAPMESPSQRRFREMAGTYRPPAHLREGYTSSTRTTRERSHTGTASRTVQHWSGRQDVTLRPGRLVVKVRDLVGERGRREFEEMLCDLYGDRARLPGYLRSA